MYPPPRPMQMPMGMLMGRRRSGSVGPAGVDGLRMRLTPDRVMVNNPGLYRSPSATVIVSTSFERLDRYPRPASPIVDQSFGALSRPMSPVIGRQFDSFPRPMSPTMGHTFGSSFSRPTSPIIDLSGTRHRRRSSQVVSLSGTQDPCEQIIADILGGKNTQSMGLQALQGLSGFQDFQWGGDDRVKAIPIPELPEGVATTLYRSPSCTITAATSVTCLEPYSNPGGIGRSIVRPTSPFEGSILSGDVIVADGRTPIIMTEPVTDSRPLSPQMQQLVQSGIPGYSGAVTVLLTPDMK